VGWLTANGRFGVGRCASRYHSVLQIVWLGRADLR
jgi:hypothetical protein